MKEKTTSRTLRWALTSVNNLATHGIRYSLRHQSDGSTRTYLLVGDTPDGKRRTFIGKAKEIQMALDVLEWMYTHSPEVKERILAEMGEGT